MLSIPNHTTITSPRDRHGMVITIRSMVLLTKTPAPEAKKENQLPPSRTEAVLTGAYPNVWKKTTIWFDGGAVVRA